MCNDVTHSLFKPLKLMTTVRFPHLKGLFISRFRFIQKSSFEKNVRAILANLSV